MIEFKLVGNWKAYELVLASLPTLVRQGSVSGQRKIADKLIRIVKNHINNQDLGWKERSPRTFSIDSRILVNYEEYYHAIKAWRKNNIYYIGVREDEYNHRGIRISDIAAYHEYGTSEMPARPLWKPSLKEIGGRNGVKQAITLDIYNKIKILRSQGFEVDFRL